MQIWRLVYAILAVLFMAGLIVQVFLAGVGLFGAGDLELHRDVGYWLPLIPLLMLPIAWPARPGRGIVWLNVALFVAAFVQTLLPSLRGSVALIAALHPVNALLLFWLGLTIARRAVAMARGGAPVSSPAPEPSSQQA